MRRLALTAVLAITLAAVPATASAGWGSLIKAATTAGKIAGKAGKVAKVGKGSAALKGGAALKGASVLGVAAAADGVFAHTAGKGARVGLFVADDGAGALTVITRSGDELAHTPDSFARYVDDLDQMAQIAPDAGVDVFIDPAALGRIDSLSLGANTKLWLANPSGPSRPLRAAADGVAEVALDAGRHADGSVAWSWVRMGTNLAQLALKLADIEDHAAQIVVADADCAASPTGAVLDPSLRALGTTAGTAVVITDGVVLDGAELRLLADLHGIDLVFIGLAEVCAPGEAPSDDAVELVARVAQAQTLGELWSAGATEARPSVVESVDHQGDFAVLAGVTVSAVHRVVDTVVAELEEEDDDEPPGWFYALFGFGIVAWIGWKLRGKRSEV